ncbi:amino acid permease [Methylovirgula sp. 4M-Z18]|uniref:amino acid permease n=1 Tax=Methylovirgula sp. 4M-Z18 TaxID=2293567 RepID=UPI000E2EFA32|nr:amino acid permease [Methylovirgula sp. 4M-Z18]RFB78190.1 amino acid permease [Methylovirgula sp. 4M-Z18]
MSKQSDTAVDDKNTLHEFGYAQELLRGMKTFQNFAISFSIICILSGCINSFSQGLGSIGGAAIGIGWPVGALCSLLFAIAMAQIGSAYPTAGGLYHWSSILGGRGYGWVTAWFNLIGLVAVLAAINVGTYLFLVNSLLPEFGIDVAPLTPDTPTTYSWLVQAGIVGAITVSQGLLNHFGIKLTTKCTDLSGYLIFIGAILLTACLVFFAPHISFERLWSFQNFSGEAGANVWPQSGNLAYLFVLCLMLPAYTITGFDASAHTAEETVNAERAVPRGMIHSVVWSGLFGWLMLCAVIVAAPDLKDAAAQGGSSFFAIVRAVIPTSWRVVLWIIIGIAQYACGLATVTSASRMIFAFSRDGGLPASGTLRKVDPKHRTPVPAIWTSVVLATLFTLYTPVYTTIAAVCVIFLYISYAMPLAAGLVAYRRSWTRMGPFDIGIWYRPIAFLCLVACGVLIYAGVQPPNDQALIVTLAVFVVSTIIWFAFERRRFQGPPMIRNRDKDNQILAAEHAVGEA